MLQLVVLGLLMGPALSSCPKGYDHYNGDIPGWGTDLGSALKVSSREWCARLCNALSRCLSFEHSSKSQLCNLNTGATPTANKYLDYAFCTKQGLALRYSSTVCLMLSNEVVPIYVICMPVHLKTLSANISVFRFK